MATTENGGYTWEGLAAALPTSVIFRFIITCLVGKVMQVQVQCRGETRDHASFVPAAQASITRVFGDGAPAGEYELICVNGAVSVNVPVAARREQYGFKSAAKELLLLPTLTKFAQAYAELPTHEWLRQVAGDILLQLRQQPSANGLQWFTLSVAEAVQLTAEGGWSEWSSFRGSTYKIWVFYKEGQVALSMLGSPHPWLGEIHRLLQEEAMQAFGIEQRSGA